MSTFLIKSTFETTIKIDVNLNFFKKIEILIEKNFDVFDKIINSNDVINEFVNSSNVIENELIIENFLIEFRVITIDLKF
jgi:hypothetical protein